MKRVYVCNEDLLQDNFRKTLINIEILWNQINKKVIGRLDMLYIDVVGRIQIQKYLE